MKHIGFPVVGILESLLRHLCQSLLCGGCAGCLLVAPVMACDDCGCHKDQKNSIQSKHDHTHDHGSGFNLSHVDVRGDQFPQSSRRQPFTFAVVGDTQGGEFGGGVLDEITRDIHALNPDYVLFPGDLVGDSGLVGWRAWEDATSILGDRRLMTPGNHDRGSNSTFNNWQSTFDWLPDSQLLGGQRGINQVDYYVDHENVRFVSISTDLPGQIFGGGTPSSFEWFQQVMADVDVRNSDADPSNDIDHVFPFSHRPVTTQNESNTGGTSGAWWRSMTGQDGVTHATSAAFLPGHWHMYQPSRPDANVDTMEIISGTGGGGLEGAAARNQHGFSLITVDGSNVTSSFYGDQNGSAGGWNFTNVLDSFEIRRAGGLPQGELALYQFERRDAGADTSMSPLSKSHRLNFNGSSRWEADATRGDVLRVEGNGYADAKNIGDNNLAVLHDLAVSFAAKATMLDGQNTLLAFGGADGALNGSLANQESANHAYRLSITEVGQLQFSWQYDDGIWQSVNSTAAVDDPTVWHEYEFQRDGDSRGVAFFVDGKQLGQVLEFDHLPSGSGSGSLFIGAGVGGVSAFDGWIDDLRIDSDSITLIPMIVGDFNADGVIDGADWQLFADALGSSGVGATDLNGDGFTNHPDFLMFQSLYENRNGEGSFAKMLSSIPEPATFSSLCCGMVLLLLLRNRRRRLH